MLRALAATRERASEPCRGRGARARAKSQAMWQQQYDQNQRLKVFKVRPPPHGVQGTRARSARSCDDPCDVALRTPRPS